MLYLTYYKNICEKIPIKKREIFCIGIFSIKLKSYYDMSKF